MSIPIPGPPDGRLQGARPPIEKPRNDGSELRPVAQALGQVAKAAGALQSLQNAERDRAFASRLVQAEADFDRRRADLEIEFSSQQRGVNAVENSPLYRERLSQAREEILGGLPTELQQVFRDRSARSVVTSTTALERHAADEGQKAQAASFEAFNQGKHRIVKEWYASDRIFADELASATPVLRAEAAMAGLAPEAREEWVAKRTSALYETRLLAAIEAGEAGDRRGVDVARGMMADEQLPAELRRYGKRVEAMGRSADAEALVQEVWDEARPLEDSGLEGVAGVDRSQRGVLSEWSDPDAALERIEELPADDPLKPLARRLVLQRAAQQQRAQNRRIDRLVDELRHLRRGGASLDDPRIVERLNRLYNPALGGGRQAQAWEAREARLAKMLRGGKAGQSADKQQKEIDRRARIIYSGLDPRERSKEGFGAPADELGRRQTEKLRELWPHVSETMREQIIANQANDARDCAGDGAVKYQAARSSALAQARRAKLKRKDEAAFLAWFDEWYSPYRAAGAKPPTQDELVARVGRAIALFEVEGFIFDDEVYGFALEGEQAATVLPADQQPTDWGQRYAAAEEERLARRDRRAEGDEGGDIALGASPAPGAQPSSSAGGDASQPSPRTERRSGPPKNAAARQELARELRRQGRPDWREETDRRLPPEY